MAGSIVIALIFAEDFQQGNAACRKKAVGSENDQDHCQEEHQQGFQWFCDANGYPIAEAQGKDAHQGKQPAGLRLRLPFIAAVQKLYRL